MVEVLEACVHLGTIWINTLEPSSPTKPAREKNWTRFINNHDVLPAEAVEVRCKITRRARDRILLMNECVAGAEEGTETYQSMKLCVAGWVCIMLRMKKPSHCYTAVECATVRPITRASSPRPRWRLMDFAHFEVVSVARKTQEHKT